MAMVQMSSEVDRVRSFNRFYTRRIGVLDEAHLDSGFTLTEARLIYELAQSGAATAKALRHSLDLDAGYVSRMLRRLESAGLLARRIGAMPLRLYAHRRYLDRHGAPPGFAAPGHRSVGFDRDWQTRRSLASLGLDLTRESFSFRTDNQLAQLAAVRAGLGVGACQVGIARRDPDLIPVLEDAFRLDLEIWVAMHEDLRSSRRMRLMFDHLVAGLTDYVKTVQTV